MANPTPRYTYDERAGRFRDKVSGKWVSQSRVTAALNDVIDAAAAELLAQSKRFQAGQLTLAQWQLIGERAIKNINLTATAMAAGGWQQVTPAMWGRVGREIREQYKYFRDFVQQIADGTQRLDGRFLQRVQQYAQSGRSWYEKERARHAANRGAMYVRSVRHARDSCEGCISQERLGWIPIDSPSFVPIGSRTCRKNCRCTLEFATAEEAGMSEAA